MKGHEWYSEETDVFTLPVVRIKDLKLEESERDLALSRIRCLQKVHEGKHYTKMNINKIFREWEEIAERVKKGGTMLNQAITPSSDKSIEYIESLNDLYVLLIKMLGLYELFFRAAFKSRPDQFERAMNTIYEGVK